MADIQMTREQPIQQFWQMTDDIRAGMLGVEGSGEHMQPMHPHCDPDGRSLWFFVKLDADIVASTGTGARAHMCVVGRDHDYHACVSGRLTVERNAAMIERFWSPGAEAWFRSKDDPDLTMLHLSLEDGVAWASTGPVLFGWAILKSGMTDTEPDVGARRHFSFVHQPRPAGSGRAADVR